MFVVRLIIFVLVACVVSLQQDAFGASPVPITEKMVKNITLPDLGGGPPTVVKDGSFSSGSRDEGDYEFGEIEGVAIGDLNGDGVDDAAFVLWTSPGTAYKNYGMLVVTGASGKPVVYPGLGLGDRIKLLSFKIVDQKILLEIMVHDSIVGKSAPPNQKVKGVFAFERNKIVDQTKGGQQQSGRKGVKATPEPAGKAGVIGKEQPAAEDHMAGVIGSWSGEFRMTNANGTPYMYTVSIMTQRDKDNPGLVRFRQDNTLRFENPASIHSCTRKNVSVFSYEGDVVFESGKYNFIQKKLYDPACTTPGTQVFRLVGNDLQIIDVNGGQIRSGVLKKLP